MKNREAERYLKEIRKNIGVGGRLRDEFLGGLSERVYEHCEENECSYEVLCATFGHPSFLAGEFFDSMPKSEMTRMVNIRKLILILVIATLAIYLLFIVISLIDVHEESHGYLTEEILMISSFLSGGC